MIVALLLLDGLMLAGVYMFGKFAHQHGIAAFAPLAWQVCAAAAAVTLVAIARGQPPRFERPVLRYAAIVGVPGFGAPNFVVFNAVASLALGMLFFGERHSAWVWLAMAAVLAGIGIVQPSAAKSAPSAGRALARNPS